MNKFLQAEIKSLTDRLKVMAQNTTDEKQALEVWVVLRKLRMVLGQ